MAKPKKKIKTLIKFGVSFALLAALIQFVDWDKSWGLIKNMNPYPIFVGIACVFLFECLNGLKMKLILDKDSAPWTQLVQINFLKTFFMMVLPGGVSGEVVRVYYLGRAIKYNSKAFGSVLVDRLTGLWVQSGLAVISLVVLSATVMAKGAAIAAGLTVMVLGIGVSLFLFPRIINIIQWVFKWINNRFGTKLHFDGTVKSLLHQTLSRKGRAAGVLGTGIVYQVLINLNVVLLITALGKQLNFFEVTVIMFTNVAIVTLPISIGGIGVSEWVFALLFTYFGLDSEIGVLVSLMIRVITMPAAFCGWLVFLKNGVSFSQIVQTAKKKDSASNAGVNQ